jgi:hypothetical protein
MMPPRTQLMRAAPGFLRLEAQPGAMPPALLALHAQVAALEAALSVRILTRGPAGPPPSNEPDRAVRIEEAVVLLGMTRDYLYRHWEKLGGYRDDDGHVKFSTLRSGRPSKSERPHPSDRIEHMFLFAQPVSG